VYISGGVEEFVRLSWRFSDYTQVHYQY